MDSGIFVAVLGFLVYVSSGTTVGLFDELTGAPSVWVKDVTRRSHNNKRIIGDPALPNQLTFNIKHGSQALTLKLKRNYQIDPNADIYFVQMSKDRLSIPTKTTTLEKEAVAYYQDMDHGAYMTVRCVNRLNQQCERVISGNIKIGETNYHLKPAVVDESPENVLEISDTLGRRYFLLDQTHIQEENLLGNKDTSKEHNTKAQDELKVLSQLFNRQENENSFEKANVVYPYQNGADLSEREMQDRTRQLKQNYYVKVAVMVDSLVWDYYSSKDKTDHPWEKMENVKGEIREAYSHIMNGVNLRYKTITDPSISISVILTDFIFIVHEDLFPHSHSKVVIEDGQKYIQASSYLYDLSDWDRAIGANHIPVFDHVMLFTMYQMYNGTNIRSRINGYSQTAGVCEIGLRISIVQARDYFRTVGTATHELGHNLGAYHDGEGEASACKQEDFFIMSISEPDLSKDGPHIKNMWTFSKCSVESFKKIMKDKPSLRNIASVYNLQEYTSFTDKQPGDIFPPWEHCSILFGIGYVNYVNVPEEICQILRCFNPTTGDTEEVYTYAARGTPCGENKWCIQGRCVSKN